MRKSRIVSACALLCVLAFAAVATAQLGPIRLIQMGMTPEGTYVEIEGAYVMAVTETGAFISEDPHMNYCGIWAYLGAGHGLGIGDFIDIRGDYEEYYDLSEINVVDCVEPGAGWEVVAYGVVINLNTLTAAGLMSNPEPWECCRIKIDSWMTVTSVEIHGEWIALADDGTVIRFDDFWYDDTTVMVGHRYEGAIGIWYYSFGAWKLEVFATGIIPADPAGNEALAWGGVKTLYR